MSQTLRVSRREIKFRCDSASMERIHASISAFMPADTYTKPEGYMVRSLYFDSMQDRDYHEANDGIEVRKKIRLRIYSPGDNRAKLELKRKNNQNQYKYSLTISRMDALSMIDGDFGVLLRYDDDEARRIYLMMTTGGYRPKSIVEYRRRAYVAEPNRIRITFDCKLYACRDLRLFARDLPLRPIMPLDQGVLEVKYNGFLFSYIRKLLEQCDRMPSANSKYVMSRSAY